jgi:hypothetical protein
VRMTARFSSQNARVQVPVRNTFAMHVVGP